MKPQTVTVNRSELLRRLCEKREEILQKRDAQERAYELAWAEFQMAVIGALRTELDRIEAGGKPNTNESYQHNYIVVEYEGQRPTKKTYDTTEIDRDIALLEMAASEVISISSDSNFMRYL